MNAVAPESPENGRTTAGGTPAEKVASTPASNPTGAAPGAPGPAPGVAEFGGNPSGKPLTKFQFPPDTAEGKEERRLADAERKRNERAEKIGKVAEPPPLPSATARQANSVLETNGTAEPGLAVAPETPLVPWEPDALSDLVSELLDAAEENRVGNFVGRLQEAGLMPKLITQIEKDSHFPKLAKVMLKRSLPRLAAKWLNKAGISAEHQDELEVVTALLLIVQHDRKSSARIDELIAEHREQQELKRQQQENEKRKHTFAGGPQITQGSVSPA